MTRDGRWRIPPRSTSLYAMVLLLGAHWPPRLVRLIAIRHNVVVSVRPEMLTLFVGAGISVPTGGPDFHALRNRFLVPLVGERDADIAMDVLSPELLFDALDDGRVKTREMIRREMWWECEPKPVGENHHAVAALAADGARVWTTNFDTLIERAALRMGTHLDVISEPRWPENATGGAVLNKVHGSFPLVDDPPLEPARHDYKLLFRSVDVWQRLPDPWRDRLVVDFAGRDVHLFGYRGADLDVVPVLLHALPLARSAVWWEMQGANVEPLRRRFAGLCDVRVGDPSAALLSLAAPSMRRHPLQRLRPPPPRRRPEPWVPDTWTARAVLRGQFRGAPAARRAYACAIVRDPWALKGGAAFRLVRSTGFDRPGAGPLLVLGLRMATRLAPMRLPARTWELYATLVDAQPVRRIHDRDVAILLSGPVGRRPEILVRVASREKRAGRLDRAAGLLESSLAQLSDGDPSLPRLEAMAGYNLAWVQRQRWQLKAREALVRRFEERRAHIGFNWSAWMLLDDALLALQIGDVARAETLLEGPAMHYARDRIRHPMFVGDERQAAALLAWQRNGVDAGSELLNEALRIVGGHGRRLTFTAVDTWVLLVDAARVRGDDSAMGAALKRAAQGTISVLQRRRIELVAAFAASDAEALRGLAAAANVDGQRLLALTAQPGTTSGRLPMVRRDQPLPALY